MKSQKSENVDSIVQVYNQLPTRSPHEQFLLYIM